MKDFDNKLNTFFTKLDDKLKRHIPNLVAETAVEHFKNAFISKSFNGQAWPAYGNPAREPRRGSLMMRSNALFNSIRPSLVTPERVRISAGNSRVLYARIHNEGGRVSGSRKINSYTNRNFMGKGKAVQIRAHTRNVNYTVKQRQFMGKSPALLAEIKTRIKRLLND